MEQIFFGVLKACSCLVLGAPFLMALCKAFLLWDDWLGYLLTSRQSKKPPVLSTLAFTLVALSPIAILAAIY
jgi:hypothetical protein